MNFHIGQKVVALQTASSSGHTITKDSIYTIRGITACKCGTMLDIGFDVPVGTKCSDCSSYFTDKILWACATLFAPLQDNFAEEVLEKAYKESELEPQLN